VLVFGGASGVTVAAILGLSAALAAVGSAVFLAILSTQVVTSALTSRGRQMVELSVRYPDAPGLTRQAVEALASLPTAQSTVILLALLPPEPRPEFERRLRRLMEDPAYPLNERLELALGLVRRPSD